MARFTPIDVFVIDHAFQPIADRLELHDISIFSIARFLLDGTAAAFAADLFCTLHLSDYVAAADKPIAYTLAAVALITVLIIARVNRLLLHTAERAARPGMLNPARYHFFPMRLVCVGLCVTDGLGLFFDPQLSRLFGLVAWLLWALATYLASCSRRPGLRQMNRRLAIQST